MPTSQSPQTYYGSVPPPGGPGYVWATRQHMIIESAYVMSTGPLVSQVTQGDGATVDGSADVGVVIDGAIFSVTTPATVAALVTGLNAIPAFAAIAVASNPAGTTLRVAFLDYAVHTVTSYSPGTPDITAITNTVSAANPVYVKPGMGVCIDTAAPGGAEILTVKLPTTAVEAARCVGIVGAPIFGYSPDAISADGYNPELGIPPGKAFALHREDYIRLATVGEITKDADAALIFSAANRGMWMVGTAGGGTPQVTRGDVVFNGTDLVGLAIDGGTPLAVASNTSDDQTATDLMNAWNANAAYAAIATASIDLSGTPSYIILTFLDNAVHTVAAYSPATADVTGITNTTAAVAATAAVVPGVRFAKGAPSSLGSAPAEVDLD